MFKNMKLKTKIIGGFSVVLAISVIVSVLTMVNMMVVEKQSKQLSQEYIPQVGLAHEIEQNVLRAMVEVRTYSLNGSSDSLREAKNNLNEGKKYLNELRNLVNKHASLSNLKNDVESWIQKVNEYEKYVSETESKTSLIMESHKNLDQATSKYITACHNFLNSEYSDMQNDLRSGANSQALNSHLLKITLLNDIINEGNTICTATYKSFYEDKQKTMQSALSSFDTIEQKIEELRPLSSKDISIRELDEIKETATAFKSELNSLSSNLNATNELFAQRNKVAQDLLIILRSEVLSGIKRTENVGSKTVSTLTFSTIFLLLSLLISVAVGVVISSVITKGITTPIYKIQQLMGEAKEGNFNVRGTIESSDEIGELTNSFNTFMEKISQMIINIFDTIDSLTNSSTQLAGVAENLTATSEETTSMTEMVSAATEEIGSSMEDSTASLESVSQNMTMIASSIEEITSTINSLASASEQTSVSVTDVSGLVEQMSVSFNTVSSSATEVSKTVKDVETSIKVIKNSICEINENCNESKQISVKAEENARSTNLVISDLNTLSKKIGKIVSVISDIADQTNMLALNAAIEAAGAGEAGKGFAVVAREVKELAKQTADATEEIRYQIEDMQSEMTQAVASVETITNVIKEMTGITSEIAQSINEQSAIIANISNSTEIASKKVSLITEEIGDVAVSSQNVARITAEASESVSDIARSAQDISLASNGIARNTETASIMVSDMAKVSGEVTLAVGDIAEHIRQISAASNDTATGALDTSASARELMDLAQKFDYMVKQFKI